MRVTKSLHLLSCICDKTKPHRFPPITCCQKVKGIPMYTICQIQHTCIVYNTSNCVVQTTIYYWQRETIAH